MHGTGGMGVLATHHTSGFGRPAVVRVQQPSTLTLRPMTLPLTHEFWPHELPFVTLAHPAGPASGLSHSPWVVFPQILAWLGSADPPSERAP